MISTPRFGGCRDPNDSEQIVQCALSPDQCSPSNIYVQPHEILNNACQTGSQVTLGRCTSNLDANLCTPFPAACEISAKFVRDDTCDVISDETSPILGPSTRYLHCLMGPSKPKECVLSVSDCEDKDVKDGEVISIRVATGGNYDPCFCHHVPTGLCYLEGVLPITPDSSFCSVGAHDCPDAYTYLSVHELLRMESPPRTCRLCLEEDSQRGNQRLHEQVVESGGCYTNDTLMRCALESSQCDAAATFQSSHEMRFQGHVPCPAAEVSVGRCTSSAEETSGCAGTSSTCYLPAKFQPRGDSSCTVHTDAGSTPTYFGKCWETSSSGGLYTGYRCLWDKSDCVGSPDTKYIWEYATQPRSGAVTYDGCDCEHVQTGACEYYMDGIAEYYCAVSEKGCSPYHLYKQPHELEDSDIDIQCRLCQPRRNNPTMSPTVTVTTGSLSIDEQTLKADLSETNSLNRTEVADAGLIGVAVGVSAGAAMVIIVVYVMVWLKSRKQAVTINSNLELEVETASVNDTVPIN